MTEQQQAALESARAKGSADTDEEIDALAAALVEGVVKLGDVRIGGCPQCGGKLRSSPTPNWMNRRVCDGCGRIFSG